MRGGGFHTSIVARSTDHEAIEKVVEDVAALMRAKGGDPVRDP